MEEALHDVPLYRDFAGLDIGVDAMPDESTILRFRHLLEEHQLAPCILELVNDLLQEQGLLLQKGTTVDATLIAAPTSAKNSTGKRDAQMHSSKTSNQWCFGMKAHRLDLEKTKASLRAKVEHAFRVLKCQFGYREVRHKGLKKNTAQLHTLFALVNLWMVRKKLVASTG